MDSGSIATIVSAFLALASVVLGAKYRQGLRKAKQLTQLLDEIIAATEDDTISEEEFQQIVAKAKRVAADVEE